jgi:hypothetical protein
MTCQREVLDESTVRFRTDDATTVVSTLTPGVVLLTLTGHDTGGFGSAVFEELERHLAGGGRIELFVDTRDAFNATTTVSSAWSAWFQTNRAAIKQVSVLVTSKFVQLTAEVIKLFSRTGELMRIYTDAPAFSDAVAQATGAVFVLGAPRA